MTDSYKSFLVTLGNDVQDETAENIITALQMIRGVIDVTPHISTYEDWEAYERVRREFSVEFNNMLNRHRK